MTVERRIKITMGVLVLFVLGTGLTLFWTSRLVEDGIKRTKSTSQAVQSSFMLSILMNEYLDHGTSRALRQWERHREALGKILDEMVSEPTDSTMLTDLKNSFRTVNSLAPQVLRIGSPLNSKDELQDSRSKDMLKSLMAIRLEQLLKAANDLNGATQSVTLNRRNFVQNIIVAGSILLVVIILINIYLIRKSVVNPLKVLSAGAERIGSGHFDHIAEIRSDDEVGRLGQAFNKMVERLEQRDMALKQARHEVEVRLEERSAALQRATTYNDLLHTIQNVQTQFIFKMSQQEVFQNLLHDLLTLTNSEFGFIGEILHTDDGKMFLRDRAITDISWDEESRKTYEKFAKDKGLDFHNIKGLWGSVILTGEPVISNDPANDPRRSRLPEGHPRIDSFLGLPFHYEGEVIGMAGLANRPGGYDKEFVDFLQPYVTTCAHIIEAFRNERRRRSAEQQLAEAHADLERKVLDRTAELELANEMLIVEIEERKRAQEAATAERKRLYDVFETLPAYLVLLTPDYHVDFANRFFRERFGESHGRRCFEYLFNRTEPCEICDTYTVLKTMAPHFWEWTGPDERNYDVYDFPFIDADGSTLILEMGIDVTERKQAEAALNLTLADLSRSNKDLQQFAYVASHDLQEPLRNVASCLRLLEKKYKNKLDAEADQYIYYAVESAVRMKALIQDLLAYSRIGTHGKPLQPTDCEKVLDETLKNLRFAISDAKAVITHDPLPTIFADEAQMSQVFQNIIGNAIKFHSDDPPRIHVSSFKNEKEWIFSVKDNGIGFEARHLDRIFVIFQRLNKRTEYDGTGMGLAIVKKVVERHRGRVWAQSEPGVGTTFYFSIPEKESEIR